MSTRSPTPWCRGAARSMTVLLVVLACACSPSGGGASTTSGSSPAPESVALAPEQTAGAAPDSQVDAETTMPTVAPTSPLATSDSSGSTPAPSGDLASGDLDTGAPQADRAGPPSVETLLSSGRPIVLAHGGGENVYPGETLYAFERSVADGVDMLDFNVQLSADGVLVVFHDDEVDRRTDGSGAVVEMTFDELAALDGAYFFDPLCGVCADGEADAYPYRGVRTGETSVPAGFTAEDFAIPSLEQVLERFPSVPLNIEVKGNGAQAKATVDALIDQLDRANRLDSTVVSSFDDAIVEYVRAEAPQLAVSPGVSVLTGWVLERTPIPGGMRILQLPPEFEGTVVITPDLIADSVAAGYVVWVWPNDRALENQSSYEEFLELGIEGLNINDPAAAIKARNEFERSDR